MRIHSLLLRCTLALTFAASVTGPAPAAAQTLVLRVGDPIPYRVDLPAVAMVTTRNHVLRAISANFIVEVSAVDMLPQFDRQALPTSDAEARRVLTSTYTDSDSLLFGLLHQNLRSQNEELVEEAREIRTLGGERSGYLRGRITCTCGTELRVETHATVKDGIAYILTFVSPVEAAGLNQPVWARIRDSFVPAEAPPAQPAAASADLSRS